MESFEALFLLIAVQGYFLALLLLMKRPRTLPAVLLAIFIALISTETLLFHLLTTVPPWAHAVMANRPIWFLYGPVAYGFARTITGNIRKPGRLFGLHIVPFSACAALLGVGFFSQEPDFKLAFLARYLDGKRPLSDTVISLSAVIHLSAYGVALGRYLGAHSKKGRDVFSSPHRLRVRSLVIMSAVLLLAAGLLFYNWVNPFVDTGAAHDIIAGGIFVIMSITVYSMGYFGLCRPEYFDTESVSSVYRDASEKCETADVRKMESDDERVSESSAAGLRKISAYMERERPFLSSDFSLQDLSVGLGVPAHALSRIINRETGGNFFQFVNGYRIDEVKRQLADPANGAQTLLTLALDAGFNSKSSFNAAFKKVTGMPPSQYRKQLK